jgi:hypothetical protein
MNIYWVYDGGEDLHFGGEDDARTHIATLKEAGKWGTEGHLTRLTMLPADPYAIASVLNHFHGGNPGVSPEGWSMMELPL